MTRMHKRAGCLAMGLGLILSGNSGCQTYFPQTGQTLPTGHYLQHPPQYFPPTPPFPLPREQAAMEQAGQQAAQPAR